MDIKSVAEELVKLTTKEVNELTVILKDEYGIEACQTSVPIAPKNSTPQKDDKRFYGRNTKPYVPRKILSKGYSSKKIRH